MKAKSSAAPPLASQRADAEQVLDILRRWDHRMRDHQTQKRAQERCSYPARLALYHHGIASADGNDNDPSPITVWARNVSLGGIGFIYKGRIAARQVVLCLDPDLEGTTWVHAEIVRSRRVHNDFWDYGAKFLGRATADEAHAATLPKR
jgi:hypothetical protein